MLRDDRSPQRELVVAEHAVAQPEIAVDEVGRCPVAELERERTARVERVDVPGVLDERQIVRARRLGEPAQLLGEPRDLEPRTGAFLWWDGLVRAQGR
jgi:hypothetical protein